MLIEFRFKNYRSFRDEAVLSMEATGLGSFKKSLIPWSSTTKLLPAIAIYGKNGGGKSNVIRAFWLAVQFIRNAQRTQHESSTIPVNPFALNDYSKDEPTSFDFEYTMALNIGMVFRLHERKSFPNIFIMHQRRNKRRFSAALDRRFRLRRILPNVK